MNISKEESVKMFYEAIKNKKKKSKKDKIFIDTYDIITKKKEEYLEGIYFLYEQLNKN
jgi:hypothetical protein